MSGTAKPPAFPNRSFTSQLNMSEMALHEHIDTQANKNISSLLELSYSDNTIITLEVADSPITLNSAVN